MNGALSLLLRVLVQRYYMLNSGFFLVLFLLLFGIIDPAASIRLHTDLMVMMGARPLLLAGALALLGLYYLKCLRFALQQVAVPENGMLYELQALPRSRFRAYLAVSFLALYAPALGYCACLIVVSAGHGAWAVIGVTSGVQAALLALAIRSLERRFVDRLRPSRFAGMLSKLERLRPAYLGFGQYFGAYLLTQRKTLLLLLKGGSLLLLQLMVWINRDEPEPTGTFYVLLFLIVAHGLIPWHLRQFSESLPWLRNLPISVSRRFAAFAGTYALLFLPELIFLLLHVHSSLSYAQMLSFYALSVAMLCGLHAMLYVPGFNMDRYLLLMLMTYPLCIISLAIVTPWILAIFWIVLAALIFRWRYHLFELSASDG